MEKQGCQHVPRSQPGEGIWSAVDVALCMMCCVMHACAGHAFCMLVSQALPVFSSRTPNPPHSHFHFAALFVMVASPIPSPCPAKCNQCSASWCGTSQPAALVLLPAVAALRVCCLAPVLLPLFSLLFHSLPCAPAVKFQGGGASQPSHTCVSTQLLRRQPVSLGALRAPAPMALSPLGGRGRHTTQLVHQQCVGWHTGTPAALSPM